MTTCPFCDLSADIVLENADCLAFYDEYPVSNGHLLIIPKLHRVDYFDLTYQEKYAMGQLLDQAKALLDEKFQPDGYNIGLNCGESAGQSVFHCHLHLIPRYRGDTPNAKGGVRGVIPDKMAY